MIAHVSEGLQCLMGVATEVLAAFAGTYLVSCFQQNGHLWVAVEEHLDKAKSHELPFQCDLAKPASWYSGHLGVLQHDL